MNPLPVCLVGSFQVSLRLLLWLLAKLCALLSACLCIVALWKCSLEVMDDGGGVGGTWGRKEFFLHEMIHLRPKPNLSWLQLGRRTWSDSIHP